MTIEPGQSVVFWDGYGYIAGVVTRVSEKQIRTRRANSDASRHHRPEEIVFAGTAEQATDLLMKLTSLEGRYASAQRQLAAQHDARVKATIEVARRPAPADSSFLNGGPATEAC